MALLSKIVLNTTPGLNHVTYSPGLLGSSIVAVVRTGIQQDKVAAADINNGGTRQWCLTGGISLRIKFPTALPFESGEKVYVIYKPIV
jgi:hypothetical protein